MNVQFIQTDSSEYQSLCDLRYRVFFQERGFPRSIIFDEHESTSWYAAIVATNSTDVLACGRLTALTAEKYQISQMAVDPNWQGQKLGQAILLALLEKAANQGARTVVADARTSAIGFYQRCGFVVVSDEFPSAKTGTPHVIMQRTFVET